jgi:hypothetical protein
VNFEPHYVGNLAGLQAYISEIISWKNDFKAFLENRKKLWVFLMSKLSPNMKYEIFNREVDCATCLATSNTFKLYDILKEITGVYTEQNVSKIKEE